MSGHTPGPWKVVAIDWADNGNARFEIAGIRRTGMADAHLIEAAPDLLEAATVAREALSTLIASGDPVVFADALAKLDAAIAKACGGAT